MVFTGKMLGALWCLRGLIPEIVWASSPVPGEECEQKLQGFGTMGRAFCFGNPRANLQEKRKKHFAVVGKFCAVWGVLFIFSRGAAKSKAFYYHSKGGPAKYTHTHTHQMLSCRCLQRLPANHAAETEQEWCRVTLPDTLRRIVRTACVEVIQSLHVRVKLLLCARAETVSPLNMMSIQLVSSWSRRRNVQAYFQRRTPYEHQRAPILAARANMALDRDVKLSRVSGQDLRYGCFTGFGSLFGAGPTIPGTVITLLEGCQK